jgi:hypothetical protein
MKQFLLLSIALVVAVSYGCGMEMTRVDTDFGTSQKLAVAGQILDPDAEKNVEPVYGMSGVVSEKVAKKYAEGFETKTESPTYVFQVGTGK